MAASKDERARILHLIEEGQVTALQAAQLLDALETDGERPDEHSRDRIIRVRMTSLNPRVQKANLAATSASQPHTSKLASGDTTLASTWQ